MLVVKNGSKKFGQDVALDDLNLEVKSGDVFCLLGENGAGKTTFIKILLGLVQKDQGEIAIENHDFSTEHWRHIVSFLPEKFSFYDFYKVDDVLIFYAKMRGPSSNQIKSGEFQLPTPGI